MSGAAEVASADWIHRKRGLVDRSRRPPTGGVHACRQAAPETRSPRPGVRVVIVTGVGDKAFPAGVDLRRLIPLFSRAREPEDEWDRKLLADGDIIWKPRCCEASSTTNR
jgi:hypothetical protein